MNISRNMARNGGLNSETNAGEAAISVQAAILPGSHFAISGSNGANTLNGSAFSDWIYGNGGDDKLFGNGGKDLLFGGIGNDLLAGGSGNDQFVFTTGDGDDTILDFQDGADIINLAGFSEISDFGDLMNNVAQIGDDLQIDLGNGDSIKIENIDKSALSADDFIF
jgi:Ca2+-binding RTX toxin-like protein